MKVLGLCGGSGSGKGTVSRLFSYYGIPSIDTDAVYHELTSSKTPCVDALCEKFGKEILKPDGSLDRSALSKIVFCGEKSDEMRRSLNSISHKFVLETTREMLKKYEAGNARAVIVDAPLLFESGFNAECDFVISVIADKQVRISRIVARDGISEEMAFARIKSQLSDEYLVENSDFVIENSGSLAKTSLAVSQIVEKILK